MPCTPLPETNVIPPNSGTFPGSNGFAVALPSYNIPFAPSPVEDLTSIFNQLSFILPPGTLKPKMEPNVIIDVYGAVNSLLEKFSPFLMLYKFFLPVLNLILCIIEVLCSLLNPFTLGGAISNLFRNCIPEFLSIFPAFAIPIMIMSLLLLILSLIEYLITRIIGIIDVIVANLNMLGKAAPRLDNDSIIGIVKKIGDLLCSLQNLFVVFGVLTTIIQIIKAILSLGFRIPPCSSSGGNPSSCCTPDVCPAFIKNNSDIISSTGTFLYYNEVGIDSGLVLPASFPPIISSIRSESWQFYDANLSTSQAFSNIVKAYDLPAGTSKIFFPGGTNYTTTTDPNSTPYTISFRFFYVPADFSYNPTDPKGPRYMRIVNAIVKDPPTLGVSSYNNDLVAPFNGTLNLIGGVVTEDNGDIVVDSQNRPIPLNTFIHQNSTNIPANEGSYFPNDGYLFQDLTYTFTINHEVLVGESLITLGCIPEVAVNKDFINNTIGAQFNGNSAALANITLPDVAGTQDAIINAIAVYSQSVSIPSTNLFQATVLGLLNNLQQQTNSSIAQVIPAAYDQYTSSFYLSTNIQFITQPITIFVSINESSSQSLTNNLPSDVATSIASQIQANVSLGSVGPFSYDGYQLFMAEILSDTPGNGTVKVSFDNNYISILNNPTDITQTPSVSVNELNYTFVYSPSISSSNSSSSEGGAPRRDEGDIARDGTIDSGS
jgi:hypothetical protein